jgi:hypothetical protein
MGGVQYQPGLLATLQRRDLDRVGEHLAGKRSDAGPMSRRATVQSSGAPTAAPSPLPAASSRSSSGMNTSRSSPGAPFWSTTAAARSSASSAVWACHGSSASSATANFPASLVPASHGDGRAHRTGSTATSGDERLTLAQGVQQNRAAPPSTRNSCIVAT